MTFTPITGDQGSHPDRTVVRIEHESPRTLASAVARETDTHVWVLCEGNCGTAITVGKAHWIPVNFADPYGPSVEVRLTAAPARRCGKCGPSRRA